MAGRYLVTGVQLAMLATLPDKKDRLELTDDIVDNQWVSNSTDPVEKDADKLADFLFKRKKK